MTCDNGLKKLSIFINGLAQGQTKVPRSGIDSVTY